MVEAVWFVNTRSYAIETSPAAVNSWGRAEVIFVVSTENSSDELSYMANRLPVVSPYCPMFILTRSPDDVAQAEGDQSKRPRLPVERLGEVELALSIWPVVSKLASRFSPIPCVNASKEKSATVPVVIVFEFKVNSPLVVVVSRAFATNLAELVAIPPTIASSVRLYGASPLESVVNCQ